MRNIDALVLITTAQYVQVMSALSSWEEGQNTNAKATLRNSGDYYSV